MCFASYYMCIYSSFLIIVMVFSLVPRYTYLCKYVLVLYTHKVLKWKKEIRCKDSNCRNRIGVWSEDTKQKSCFVEHNHFLRRIHKFIWNGWKQTVGTKFCRVAFLCVSVFIAWEIYRLLFKIKTFTLWWPSMTSTYNKFSTKFLFTK